MVKTSNTIGKSFGPLLSACRKKQVGSEGPSYQRSFPMPFFNPIYTEQDYEVFGNWLAGFIDGEGCFSLSVHDVEGRATYHASLTITLRLDDYPILRRIKRFLQSGKIHVQPVTACGEAKNAKPQAMYRVQSVQHLVECVIPMLQRCPLQAKKKRDFLIWRKGVRLLWRVQQRPNKCILRNGKIAGALAKWQLPDIERFLKIQARLIKVREYDGPSSKEIRDNRIKFPRNRYSSKADVFLMTEWFK